MSPPGWISVFGYVGGVIISCSQLPQLYKAVKTKRCKDISYGYQFIYMLGLGCSLTYTGEEMVYPVFIPMCIELSFITVMVLIKTYYDRNGAALLPLHNSSNSLELTKNGDADKTVTVSSKSDDSELVLQEQPPEQTDSNLRVESTVDAT